MTMAEVKRLPTTKVLLPMRRSHELTYLDMRLPCLLRCRHRFRQRVVAELGILAQASPQPELLARIVALVDQVPLVRVGTVALLEGFHSSVPGFLLEGVCVLVAQPDRFAEGAEEGGFVGRRPAEARALPVLPAATAGA